MTSAVRTLLAVIAGMALAFALVVAVEMFSAVVHPFPPGLDPNAPGTTFFVACLMGIRHAGRVRGRVAVDDALIGSVRRA